MKDLIDRQAAIKEAYKIVIDGDAYEVVQVETLMGLLSAQTEQQWIPVEDRLPEKPGKYLVTVQNGNVYAGTFDMVSHKFQCAATAWMELPEPYRRDES